MMAQHDNAAMATGFTPTLLGGLMPAQFMRRHWHKKPLLVRQALPGVAPPLERAALFSLVARDDVESRLIECRDGGHWRLRHGPLPRRALPPLARPGWTLLVQGLDLHVDAAHALLSRFRFVPAARLDDLMLSYASDGGGVGPHTDAYDVFLLQVQGLRRWRIGRVQRPRWREGVPLKLLASFEAEQEYVLAPGDLLYLPPGWGHDGVAQGGDCMTASIGFRAPRADELAQVLLARLADAAPARERSPRYRDPPQAGTDRPAAVPEALQRFAHQALARALADPIAVECALGEWLTEPKAQVWFEACRERSPALVGGGVRLDRRTRMLYDHRHVFINGESLHAAGRDAQAMQALANERRLDARTVRRLSSQARELLVEWLGHGWLHPLEGEGRD